MHERSRTVLSGATLGLLPVIGALVCALLAAGTFGVSTVISRPDSSGEIIVMRDAPEANAPLVVPEPRAAARPPRAAAPSVSAASAPPARRPVARRARTQDDVVALRPGRPARPAPQRPPTVAAPTPAAAPDVPAAPAPRTVAPLAPVGELVRGTTGGLASTLSNTTSTVAGGLQGTSLDDVVDGAGRALDDTVRGLGDGLGGLLGAPRP